ncbi:alpha/beta fold hydrolase [Maliponia aquimaris]|uniref:Alpha/beta hydrolase family protein n=1 Tax=Maliponia aquimaris TaxID=1673631 RepID=A0A238L7I5_9RHOB|nr:alpha/beta hydrolase [Maliponia aquimaris]SMX50811.1 Alpha/beta hydrolase family protein [Maliponia aquimaris]
MAIEDLRSRNWVLLPGTLCTGAIFDGFLDVLGVPVTRRHSVELRQPTVDAYESLLNTRAKGAVLCGFSLGAIVAAHLADRRSPARIILFGLNPYPDDPRKAVARHALARDVVTTGGAAALRPRLPALHGPAPDRVRVALLAMANASASDIAAQTQLALTRPGALAALSGAQAPVMVLTGGEDDSAPVAQGQAAAQAAPMGQFADLPGLGHYALLEGPEACANALVRLEAAVEYHAGTTARH